MGYGKRDTPAPACCPRCLRNWQYVTSGPLGIGGLVRAVHPPGPCVPPPPVVVEPEPRKYQRTDEAECQGCGVTFKQKRCSQLYCEPACRVRWFKRLKIVARVCVGCGGEFRTVYRKQVTCSETCRRRYRKQYHAAQWINRRVREYQQHTRRRAA